MVRKQLDLIRQSPATESANIIAVNAVTGKHDFRRNMDELISFLVIKLKICIKKGDDKWKITITLLNKHGYMSGKKTWR